MTCNPTHPRQRARHNLQQHTNNTITNTQTLLAAIALYGHTNIQHTPGQPSKTECGCPSGREMVFPKKARIILRKTNADPIWMVWSGFGQTHLVWKQDGVQESAGPVSGKTQPLSHFQTRCRSSTDVPDNTVQNQPGSDLVLADCVRFWPNGSGPDANR